MARGGKRAGSGRPAGAVTIKTRQVAEQAINNGLTPLDYMLAVLRDLDAEIPRRDDMAKAAAPYVHAKLSSVDANVKANVDGSITFTWLPPS